MTYLTNKRFFSLIGKESVKNSKIQSIVSCYSPVCILSCADKFERAEYDFGHNLQTYGFTSFRGRSSLQTNSSKQQIDTHLREFSCALISWIYHKILSGKHCKCGVSLLKQKCPAEKQRRNTSNSVLLTSVRFLVFR